MSEGTGMTGRLRLYGRMPAWFDDSGPECDVVISTRVRLARNIAGYKFPARASSRDKQKIYDEAVAAINAALGKNWDMEAVSFGRLNKIEQLFLIEERRVSMDMLKAEGERGAVCDISGRLNIMINEEDHLRIQCMGSGFHTFGQWAAADKVDDAIGKKLKYAYSERLGFLTACPTNSGTGLRVSYLMHLPGLVLTKTIDPVLQAASQMGLSTRGFFGEHSDVVGNFFQLSNLATLGASEKEFIESTSNTIREIIGHERDARQKLLKNAPFEVSDKIYRAYGILRNARMLSIAEFLNLTSALRLGINSGLYKEHTIYDLNRMIMICMPAHLQIYISDKYKEMPELDVARADTVRALFSIKNERAQKTIKVEKEAVKKKVVEKKVVKKKTVKKKT